MERVWEDKKRHFGLPISFTKYYIENERLYVKTGLLRSVTNEVLLYRILDVKSFRTLGQRLFGVGTVVLYCADQSSQTIKLENIKNCDSVHRQISDLVEQIRVDKGISGSETYGIAGMGYF